MKNDPGVLRFFRNAHVFRVLVEEVLERGPLKRIGANLSFEDLNILKFIARPCKTFIGDLRRFQGVSFAAVSKTVTKLKERRYITSRTYPEDRRAEVLSLTGKGKKAVRRYEEVKMRRMEEGLGSAGDLDGMSAGLEKAISLLMRQRPLVGNPCLGCGAYYSESCIVRRYKQTCPCHVPTKK